SQDDFEEGPRVSLLQSNLDQRIRNAVSGTRVGPADAKRTMHDEYMILCAIAQKQRPELIVWPETSFPMPWLDISARATPHTADRAYADDVRKKAASLAALCGSAQLLGVNALVLDDQGREIKYNSAVLVRKDGTVAGRYDKVHRVPFGEYVPFRDW